MGKRKRVLGVKISILFLFSIISPAFFTSVEAAMSEQFTIMHTNDMHGRMEYMEDQYSPSIGLGRVKTFKNMEKPTVLVDAGDAMQGLPISNYSKGMDMVKAMNAVGYDAMTLGNHEFDFGLETALLYQKELKFPIISANIFYKDGTRPFEPYTIVKKQVGDENKNVALIGLTTPETTVKTHPNNVGKITFKKPAPIAIDMIKEIGNQADYFVFMTHLGLDETTVEDETSKYLATELAKVYPDKKIFIADGHSHTPLPKGIQTANILIGQTGNHLNNVGMMTGDYTNEIPKLTAVLHPFDELKSLIPDSEVEKVVATAKANFDKEMSDVVLENNKITFNGERENTRTRETNLGNLIGDSLLDYGKTGFKEASDFAIMNGGGIRQTIKPGKVTKGEIVGVMPFGNTVSQIKVTGNEIYKMFEHSLRSIHAKDESGKVILDENGVPKLGANGGFLHVSNSIKVIYDSNKQGSEPEKDVSGKRVATIQIKNKDGQFVDVLKNDQTTYNMVTNDFLAAGGDGYTMLAGKAVEQGPSMDEVFMAYLTKLTATQLDNYKIELPYTRIISKKEITSQTPEQDQLAKTIKESENLKEEDYSIYSWTAFKKDIEEAKIELATKDETKAKTGNDNLLKAKSRLVNTVSLQKLVEESSLLKETDYTSTTWKVFSESLGNATTLLKETKEVTSKEVSNSEAALKTAKEKLVLVGNISKTPNQDELETTIKRLKKLTKADFTAQSWSLFEPVLIASETKLAVKDETLAKQATTALVKAESELVKIKELKELVTESKKLKEADYTKDSWKYFSKSLSDSQTLLKKAESVKEIITNQQVKGTKEGLEMSISKLVSVKDVTDKKKAYAVLPQTDEKEDYYVTIGLVLISFSSIYVIKRNKYQETV